MSHLLPSYELTVPLPDDVRLWPHNLRRLLAPSPSPKLPHLQCSLHRASPLHYSLRAHRSLRSYTHRSTGIEPTGLLWPCPSAIRRLHVRDDRPGLHHATVVPMPNVQSSWQPRMLRGMLEDVPSRPRYHFPRPRLRLLLRLRRGRVLPLHLPPPATGLGQYLHIRPQRPLFMPPNLISMPNLRNRGLFGLCRKVPPGPRPKTGPESLLLPLRRAKGKMPLLPKGVSEATLYLPRDEGSGLLPANV
jgi:hypothetical protein